MNPSENAFNLAKKFEGCKLTCYADTGGIATIGWGNTKSVTVADIGYKTITQEEADDLLQDDMNAAAQWVSKLVEVDLTQNQFDALADFVYNEGYSRFSRSTLLKFVNEQDFDNAALAMCKWVYGVVNGQEEILQGLVARREAERSLFVG